MGQRMTGRRYIKTKPGRESGKGGNRGPFIVSRRRGKHAEPRKVAEAKTEQEAERAALDYLARHPRRRGVFVWEKSNPRRSRAIKRPAGETAKETKAERPQRRKAAKRSTKE